MDSFEDNLNALLVDTFNDILKFEEKSLQSLLGIGVTVNEAHVLEAVGKGDGVATISDIANFLKVSLPSAAVAVQKLERRGFVEKTPDRQDGRKMNVSLTALGEKLDRAHRIFHRKMVKDISGVLSDEDKGPLLSRMEKLSLFFRQKI